MTTHKKTKKEKSNKSFEQFLKDQPIDELTHRTMPPTYWVEKFIGDDIESLSDDEIESLFSQWKDFFAELEKA